MGEQDDLVGRPVFFDAVVGDFQRQFCLQGAPLAFGFFAVAFVPDLAFQQASCAIRKVGMPERVFRAITLPCSHVGELEQSIEVTRGQAQFLRQVVQGGF